MLPVVLLLSFSVNNDLISLERSPNVLIAKPTSCLCTDCTCASCDGQCEASRLQKARDLSPSLSAETAAIRKDLALLKKLIDLQEAGAHPKRVAKVAEGLRPVMPARNSSPVYRQPANVCRPGMPCYKPVQRGFFGRVIGR